MTSPLPHPCRCEGFDRREHVTLLEDIISKYCYPHLPRLRLSIDCGEGLRGDGAEFESCRPNPQPSVPKTDAQILTPMIPSAHKINLPRFYPTYSSCQSFTILLGCYQVKKRGERR
jgi:hypothetical protein